MNLLNGQSHAKCFVFLGFIEDCYCYCYCSGIFGLNCFSYVSCLWISYSSIMVGPSKCECLMNSGRHRLSGPFYSEPLSKDKCCHISMFQFTIWVVDPNADGDFSKIWVIVSVKVVGLMRKSSIQLGLSIVGDFRACKCITSAQQLLNFEKLNWWFVEPLTFPDLWLSEWKNSCRNASLGFACMRFMRVWILSKIPAKEIFVHLVYLSVCPGRCRSNFPDVPDRSKVIKRM